MPKSYVQDFLVQAYLALFNDIQDAYPALKRELSRDRVRFLHAVHERGIPLFMVDLPRIGKHLDRCLDVHEYVTSGLPLTKRISSGVPLPKFLGGLHLLVFLNRGHLREDYDVQAIFFLRQFYNMAKKVTLQCPEEATCREIQSFFDLDRELPEPDPFWDSPPQCGTTPTERFVDRCDWNTPVDMDVNWMSSILETLDLVAGILTSTLGSYRPEEWEFRHGPGAIADTTRPTNKYRWFGWSQRLEAAFPIADCGFHNYSSWAGRAMEPTAGEIRAARLIAVPKTFTKPRLIAAEPSEHQWCQQNIWHYLRSRASDSWIGDFIAFRDQGPNQRLCISASRDGGLSTVDLSSASDRVTPAAVGCLFRANPSLVRALAACRTQFVVQRIDRKVDRLIELNKFSTMGSAVTFPVESLLFLSIALTSVLYERRVRPSTNSIKGLLGQVSVFGDDIIVPTDCRTTLDRLLSLLWFKVNTDKSFSGHSFRESCGVDAFDGIDVTPSYLRVVEPRGAEQIAGLTETHNNFYSKWLLHVSDFLRWTVGRRMTPTPVGSATVGLQSRLPVPLPIERWNKRLQREEVRVWCLSASCDRTATNDDSALHQYFTEKPAPDTKWVHGFMQRPSCRMTRRWVDKSQFLEGT